MGHGLDDVLLQRGHVPAWDSYLDDVYGAETITYPVDLATFSWFYWSAPARPPRAFVGPEVGNRVQMRSGDGWIDHFGPLGYFVPRPSTQSAFVRRGGSVWLEVMREDKASGDESPDLGFWYYEARGSGIWLDLGGSIDYSCLTPAALQAGLRNDHVRAAYNHTCATYGLIFEHANRRWRPTGQKLEHFRAVPQARDAADERFNVLSCTYASCGDRAMRRHRDEFGLETVVRWFGSDLRHLGLGSRREIVDFRQRDTTCGTKNMDRLGRLRRCTCVGNAAYRRLYLRNGWGASSESCGCSDFVRFVYPNGKSPAYRYDRVLNCGPDAPPRLARLARTSPFFYAFHYSNPEGLRGTASCNGTRINFTLASFVARGHALSVFLRYGQKRYGPTLLDGCAWAYLQFSDTQLVGSSREQGPPAASLQPETPHAAARNLTRETTVFGMAGEQSPPAGASVAHSRSTSVSEEETMRGPCGCSSLIVARYQEDVSWTSAITKRSAIPVTVVDKRGGNVGQESLSYLQWIIENYSNLSRSRAALHCVCFSQGRVGGMAQFHHGGKQAETWAHWQHVRLQAGQDFAPFSRSKQLVATFDACGTWMGMQQRTWRTGRKAWHGLLPCLPTLLGLVGVAVNATTVLRHHAGAFFIVRASAIARVPLDVYRRLAHAHLRPETLCPSEQAQRSTADAMPYLMERAWEHLWSGEQPSSPVSNPTCLMRKATRHAHFLNSSMPFHSTGRKGARADQSPPFRSSGSKHARYVDALDVSRLACDRSDPVAWPYTIDWYREHRCVGYAQLLEKSGPHWQHGAEMQLNSLLHGCVGYVPLFARMSFLSGTCGGTTHEFRMQTTAEAHERALPRRPAIVVGNGWNFDNDLGPAVRLLDRNSTWLHGAYHTGCFETVARRGYHRDVHSVVCRQPRVNVPKAVELPYVENSHCYRVRHEHSEQQTEWRGRTVYFRGGTRIFGVPAISFEPRSRCHISRVVTSLAALSGARGNRIRSKMLSLRGLPDVKIVTTAHDSKPCKSRADCESVSHAAMAREMLRAAFCLVPHGDTPDSSRLYDAIACGCVPILISDAWQGAFAASIDYASFALRIRERHFLADPRGALLNVTRGARLEALRRALAAEGSRVLYLHERSELRALVARVLGTSLEGVGHMPHQR